MSPALIIDATKCVGCRSCEIICSLSHSKGRIEPRRSAIQLHREDTKELVLVPLIRGAEESIEYTVKPEVSIIGLKNRRSISGGSRECNLCGMCAQWCTTGALTFRRS